MKRGPGIRGRYRRWRRRRAARKQSDTPRREFAYLEEISVFSLLASRIGPIAAEFTATESTSLAAEVRGNVGINAGADRAGGSMRHQATSTTGSQVVRKSIVQPHFKELYDDIEGPLVLAPAATDAAPPNARAEALTRASPAGSHGNGVPTSTRFTGAIWWRSTSSLRPTRHPA